jgi:pimeloyl-ACP methyl ester carboxylesterase
MLAPDLRGFGATGKPDVGPSRGVGADVHAVDMLALLDALGIGRVGIVSHDAGAYVAQAMARKAPERIGGLFFFDCPYPGIGHRWAAPRHLGEIWYQSFHQQPWAADLVGATRGALSTYLGHFLRHWAHRKDAFDEDLETWLDVYAMPGNLQGGFDWYLSAAEARLAVIEERAGHPEPIRNPTRVLWGRHDPILKADWADRLPEYFPDLSLSFSEGSGHFPHMEEPDAAAADIRSFFRGLVSGAG